MLIENKSQNIISKFLRRIAYAYRMLALKLVFRDRITYSGALAISKGATFSIDGMVDFAGYIFISNGDYIVARKGAKISFGKNVFLNRNVIIVSHEAVEIGDRCTFGPNVVLYDHDHKIICGQPSHSEYSAKKIVIGENCWIGAGAIILKGSTVGNNCIVGAGSVIKGNIPSGTTVYNKRNTVINANFSID